MSSQPSSPIRPVRTMILAAFAIALLAVAGTGIAAWIQFQDFGDSLTEVAGPKRYLNEVNSLIAELLEAENSLRTYALTGEKDQLIKLEVGLKSHEKRLDRLSNLAGSNEELISITDTIERYVAEKYQLLDELAKGGYLLTGDVVWNSLVNLAYEADTAKKTTDPNKRTPKKEETPEDRIKLLALKYGKTAEEIRPLTAWSVDDWIENMDRLTSESYLQDTRGAKLKHLIERDRFLTEKLLDLAGRFRGEVRSEQLGETNALNIAIEQNRDLFGLFALLVVVFCLLLLWNIFRNLDRNRQLQEQLEEEKARAEKLAAAKEEFLANMSHEIRTPMNAVIGFAEQLAGTRLNAKQKNMLDPIRQSANYLLALINDVLDYSKMDAGAFRLEQTNFRVKPVIQEVITTFAHTAQKKRITLEYVPQGKLPEIIKGDPLRLRQMLFNLMGNAVKFTEKGGVKVRASFVIQKGAKKGQMRIEVQDTGIGIAPDRLESVFSEFEQADSSTTRKYGGTGLGLPITKRLAEEHGGAIEIKSKTGEGTKVILLIPYEIGTSIKEEPDLQAGLPSYQAMKGLKVLLADDEPYNRELIQVIMDKWEIELDAVDNGKKVIERLRSGKKYDLILMDLQMPEMDGIESSKYIRKHVSKEIPILAMTATSTEKEIAAAREAGMNAHLLKPFQEVELLSLLTHWLRIPKKNFQQSTSTDESMSKPETSSNGESTHSYDLKTLYALSNQDQRMVLKMLKLFQGRSESHVRDLKRFLDAKDYAGLGARAHQMIPSCRHLGLDFLVSQLGLIESLVKEQASKPIDHGYMTQIVELIESEIKVVLEQIGQDVKKLETQV